MKIKVVDRLIRDTFPQTWVERSAVLPVCVRTSINYVLERVGIVAFMPRHFAIIHEQNGMFLALNSSDKVFIQLK